MSNELIRILMVEDDEDDFLIVKRMLSTSMDQSFEVDWRASLADAANALAESVYDVVLLDYNVGGSIGLQRLRERADDIPPVILLTGHSARDLDVTAMRGDVVDFLFKQTLSGMLLERSLRYAVERRRNETALRRLEQQFRHSQKMEALGRLAGGVAHDFNNLLTVIRSYTDLLISCYTEGDERRSDLEAIKHAADRGSDLTRQLLAFCRKRVVERRPTSVNLMITEAEKMIRRLVGRDVNLVLDLADDLPLVTADAGELEQILVNLVVNARDAMRGDGSIIVRTRSRDVSPADDGEPRPDDVCLEVSDTGIGMSDELVTKIFEPYFTTKEEFGNGLGLSTVHDIVKDLAGNIAVSSSPGHGTTFTIAFPAATADPELPAATVPAAIGDTGVTILVIDDDTEARQRAVRILRMSGYRVVASSTAAEAIRISELLSELDLVVTNTTMDSISGIDVARRVLARHSLARVLFAGDAPSLNRDNGGLPSGFVAKPYDAEDLVTAVRKTLAARPLTAVA